MSRLSCPHTADKVCYTSEASANAALEYMIRSQAIMPTADIYECRYCGHWHLTSVLERGRCSIRVISDKAKKGKISRLMIGKRQRRRKQLRKMR